MNSTCFLLYMTNQTVQLLYMRLSVFLSLFPSFPIISLIWPSKTVKKTPKQNKNPNAILNLSLLPKGACASLQACMFFVLICRCFIQQSPTLICSNEFVCTYNTHEQTQTHTQVKWAQQRHCFCLSLCLSFLHHGHLRGPVKSVSENNATHIQRTLITCGSLSLSSQPRINYQAF